MLHNRADCKLGCLISALSGIVVVLILLQDECTLLSEEQRSQLKQLEESKNLDNEVLIPVSSVVGHSA